MKLYQTLLAAAFIMAATLTGQAQQKIAIVDLQKVFDGYYKTKEADRLIKQEGSEFENTFNQMKSERDTKVKKVTELREQASNPALGDFEKQRLATDADKELDELRKMDQNIQTFSQTAQRTIAERQLKARENIIKELQGIISQVARERQYDMVLDHVSRSKNDTPIVLYTNGRDDITNDVIRIANQQSGASAIPTNTGGSGLGSGGLGFRPDR